MLELKRRRKALVLPQTAKMQGYRSTLLQMSFLGRFFSAVWATMGQPFLEISEALVAGEWWKMERLERNKTCMEKEKKSLSDHSQASFSGLFC